MEGVIRDVRLAVRALLDTPGTSAFSILLLGLGIAVSTFMFSVLYGVLFRGLDTPEPELLRVVSRTDARRPAGDGFALPMPIHDFDDVAERQTVFEGIAAFAPKTVLLGGDRVTERLRGALVTANFLDVLRVEPILGRNIRMTEDLPGAPPVVLLSYDTWRNLYQGDPAVLGADVELDGQLATVIGVLPDGFGYPIATQAWVSLREDPSSSERGEGRLVTAIGRLAKGTTPDQARRELDRIGGQLRREHPVTNAGIGVTAYTVVRATIGPDFGGFLGAMMGSAILVLLVACANVANISLARAVGRSKDAALRAALGGGALAVTRPVLAEAVILAGVGALLGTASAHVGVQLFDATITRLSERSTWIHFEIDLPVLGFVVVVTGLTVVAAGLAPALRSARADANGLLKDQARGSGGRSKGRISMALIVGEVALSCALLVAAGLMTKSMVTLSRWDYPFDTEDVLTAGFQVPPAAYSSRGARKALFDDLLAGIRSLPGVDAVSLTSDLPSTRVAARRRLSFEGQRYSEVADQPDVKRALVSPDFFRVFDVSILRGRDFRSTDDHGAPSVAIVNRAFEDRFFEARSAVGQRFYETVPGQEPKLLTVVGVVPDLDMDGFRSPGQPGADPVGYYVPLAQADAHTLALAVGPGGGKLTTLSEDVRRVVRAIDPQLPLFDVLSMAEVVYLNSWFFQVFGLIFVLFGAAALLMASLGLYGVLAFSVARRRPEMGVRMAIGASAGQVRRLVLRQGAIQVGFGLALGVPLAAGIGLGVQAMLFEVESGDPIVFITAVALLLVVGLLASWVPATRATRADPLAALRSS